jgi:DNA-binding transcriptional regulator YhcF (GntR family)
VADSIEQIVETLRSRLLRGLQARTLRVGDKLPSARVLAQEFAVDFRVVLSAYRTLSAEGLVEMRARGGVYVAAHQTSAEGTVPIPEAWLVDVLTQALSREIPPSELYEWLRRCTETLRIRAVVVTTTEDQVYGLCRELSDDFGLDAEGLTAAAVSEQTNQQLALRRADVLIATRGHESMMRAVADQLKKQLLVIDVRPDLLSGEWALLLRQPVYVVVATEDFGRMLREFFAAVPGVENLRVLVFGRDDLTVIPHDAATYITQRVRASLGTQAIPGRVLPAARTIRSESAREIFAFMVHANMAAITRTRSDGPPRR